MEKTMRGPSLREITITGRKSYRVYIVDGQEYNQTQVARATHTSSATMASKFRNNSRKTVAAWLQTKYWLSDIGLPSRTTVFRRDDHLVLLADVILATGLSEERARARGYRWQAGKCTYEQMMKPPVTRKANANGSLSQWGNLNLQPRQNTWDLDPVGSFEREQPQPEKFYHGGQSNFVPAHTTEHYQGRVF